MHIPKIGLAVAAVAAVTLAMPATAMAAHHANTAAPRVISPARQMPTHPSTSGMHCKPGQTPGTRLCTGVKFIPWKDLPVSQQAARQRIVAAHAHAASVPTGPSECEFGLVTPPVTRKASTAPVIRTLSTYFPVASLSSTGPRLIPDPPLRRPGRSMSSTATWAWTGSSAPRRFRPRPMT